MTLKFGSPSASPSVKSVMPTTSTPPAQYCPGLYRWPTCGAVGGEGQTCSGQCSAQQFQLRRYVWWLHRWRKGQNSVTSRPSLFAPVPPHHTNAPACTPSPSDVPPSLPTSPPPPRSATPYIPQTTTPIPRARHTVHPAATQPYTPPHAPPLSPWPPPPPVPLPSQLMASPLVS